ncbi:MAG: hypothetical protein RBT61_01040 [Candidatus Kapabacteria bacterium]|jgi:hypothetical protein|nr:hypothetical protein [Candidatus Kapabacteria bacterium]
MKKILLIVCVLWMGVFPVFSTSFPSKVSNEVVAVEQVVYITKTGDKYHKSSCHHLKKSKIKTTKSKAKELGYTACKVCKA